MITSVDAYFTMGCGRCARFATPDCSASRWSDGLAKLRRICRDAGLAEVLKWAHPCYVHAGRNIAIIGAFREDFRLSFFNAALMSDPAGALERQGPNTRHPDMIRFRQADDVAAMEQTILDYLAEAMGYAETGMKPSKEDRHLDLPEELVEALDADPALSEAFHGLTPGRQRSYVIHLSSAKAAATRRARIERARDKILSGKGATER